LDQEKIIELNINLDRPIMIAFLLVIILLESVFIFYGGDFSTEKEVASPVIFDRKFGEPESVDELLFDLDIIGCNNILEWGTEYWSGYHLELEYAEAIQLAKESPFVGYTREFIAFIIFREGKFQIWMK
jgi:hypothetical protein